MKTSLHGIKLKQ